MLCPHSHPEMRSPYPVISFIEFLPVNQLPSLPTSYFLLSAPQSSCVLERFRIVRRICPVAVSCETGHSPPLLTCLLYKFIWGLSFFPVEVSLGVVRRWILVASTGPFLSASTMCCQEQPEVSSDPSIKHSLPAISWLYFNKIINAGQLLRKCLPVCVMLY